MKAFRPTNRLGATAVVLALVLAIAAPATAATTPVDVSGPVDGGTGPGVVADPAFALVGTTVTVNAEHLPSAAEAAAWVDDGDFSEETGSYASTVAIAWCGNADGSGVPIPPSSFDPLQHCDGGDARSASQVVAAPAVNGTLSAALLTRDGTGTISWDDDQDPGTPDVTAPGGIGAAATTCVPVSDADIVAGTAGPCRVRIHDDDPAGTPASIFVGLADVRAKPAPTLTIASISGQFAGAEAARAGATLAITGSSWDPGTTYVARMCDAVDPDVCDLPADPSGIVVDLAGTIGGNITLPAASTVGDRVLKITQASDGQSGIAPLYVLGVRDIAINPASGGAGTAVNVIGADFDALQPVTVRGHNGLAYTADVGAGTVDSRGFVSGSIIINDPTTVAVVVTEDDNPSTEGASTGFSFVEGAQTAQLEIAGGVLTLAQSAVEFDLDPIVLTGQTQVTGGEINQVSVRDNRGTLPGWSLTVTMTDFVEVDEPDPQNPSANRMIPAGNVSVVPACAPAPSSGGDPAEIQAGPPASLDPAVAAVLCSAPPGGGGGAWHADASVLVTVPASIAAGSYQARLTLLLT